ncbi:hypothetical protein ACFVUS_12540 [Nocardia sp. NPDC058058]|uniref:hypothetical protein n=1 Tax=Nocardia sp. NPDC058058 TaxID=3346317 RepID=UPI0036D80614
MKFIANLPAQSAGGATSVTLLGEFGREDGTGFGVTRVSVTSPAAVTGAATNNFTLNVRQLRAGTPVGTVASFTAAAGANLVVEVPRVLLDIDTNPGTGVSLNVGDVLDVQLVQNGSGLAVPAGVNVTVTVN